jgi:hypothetical protein
MNVLRTEAGGAGGVGKQGQGPSGREDRDRYLRDTASGAAGRGRPLDVRGRRRDPGGARPRPARRCSTWSPTPTPCRCGPMLTRRRAPGRCGGRTRPPTGRPAGTTPPCRLGFWFGGDAFPEPAGEVKRNGKRPAQPLALGTRKRWCTGLASSTVARPEGRRDSVDRRRKKGRRGSGLALLAPPAPIRVEHSSTYTDLPATPTST